MPTSYGANNCILTVLNGCGHKSHAGHSASGAPPLSNAARIAYICALNDLQEKRKSRQNTR